MGRALTDQPLPGHDRARGVPASRPDSRVMPWKYPYSQIGPVRRARLIVGNTVIVSTRKTAHPRALAIAQIMKDAGVPEGVYMNLFATHEQVADVIADPWLRGVSLTGSSGRAPWSPAHGRPSTSEGGPSAWPVQLQHHPGLPQHRGGGADPPGGPGMERRGQAGNLQDSGTIVNGTTS